LDRPEGSPTAEQPEPPYSCNCIVTWNFFHKAAMFAPKKPDKEVALKELRKHLIVLAGWVALVRATPFVLQYLNK
jgi:hypothetical protein